MRLFTDSVIVIKYMISRNDHMHCITIFFFTQKMLLYQFSHLCNVDIAPGHIVILVIF